MAAGLEPMFHAMADKSGVCATAQEWIPGLVVCHEA